jgi:hypothetical protein
MSVKTLLPIVAAGSALAIFGVARARRKSHPPNGSESSIVRRNSHIQALSPREEDGDSSTFAHVPLTRDFWDGTSAAEPAPDSVPVLSARPKMSSEAYDALDTEDLSLEWLARATQAPRFAEAGEADDADDPAEIPADSLSMVSDASRRAAGAPSDAEDSEPLSGYEPDSAPVPERPWP